MRDMTKAECKSLQIIAAAFATGKVCEPGALALVGFVGDLLLGDLLQRSPAAVAWWHPRGRRDISEL